MVNFKYLIAVLRTELSNCTGNIKKSLFLTSEDISFLSSRGCLVFIENDVDGKYLVEVDINHLLTLCN
ncbi:MAG: hypothetical protein J6A04_03825 [Clostridia bacterium]|nr:hypothetical protein [Clostridia bacterium]